MEEERSFRYLHQPLLVLLSKCPHMIGQNEAREPQGRDSIMSSRMCS